MSAVLRGFWPRIVLAWLGVAGIMILRDLGPILRLELPDPDDVLRLVQVRDLLAGQGWFELVQHRIAPPAGVSTHWSRLVDSPIALIILMLRPWLGQATAELIAAITVPMLTLLCAMVLSARIARQLYGERSASFTCLAWLLALAALVQLQPLRIDHHSWQIVAELAAINGLLSSNGRRGALLMGTALAVGLSISLELLPFAVLVSAILALRWLRDSEQRVWLVSMLQALALASLALFLATRGLTFDAHCDTVTPQHLIALVLAAGLTRAVAALEPLPKPLLFLSLGSAALLSGALYLALAPACLAGPFAALDPLVREVWYNGILEGLPVWRQDWPELIQLVVPSLLGLGIAVAVWHQTAPQDRAAHTDFALVLAGSIVIGILVSRFSAAASAIATIVLGHGICESLRRAENLPGALRFALLPLIIAALLPGALLAQVRSAVNSPSTKAADPTHALNNACGLPGSIPTLASLPRSTLFAPFEIGPALLLRTQHSVIATGHHRAAPQIHDVITAFTASPERAEPLVRAHRAHYVIACADLVEAQLYLKRAPGGLMAQLLAGRTPPWLKPVPLPREAGSLRLWLVVPN